MEQITLTAPVTTPYTIQRLILDWGNAEIWVALLSGAGERFVVGYTGATATSLMVSLNKADLSVKSLHRRVLERLIADGKLAGTLSGVPD